MAKLPDGIDVTKPFAGYANFGACVRDNQDKGDPEAYCGRIQATVENGRKRRQGKKDKVSVNPGAGMIALYPDPAVAATLAMKEAPLGVTIEPAEALHVTLAYVPEAAQNRDALIRAAARVSDAYGTIDADVNGVARFTAGSDGVPIVVLLECGMLHAIHDHLGWSLGDLVSRKHMYLPHMTLGYSTPAISSFTPDVPRLTLRFRAISVVIGEDRFDFPLVGSSPSAYAESYRTTSHNPPHADTVDKSHDDTSAGAVDAQASARDVTDVQPVGASQLEGVDMDQTKAGKRLNTSWLSRLRDMVTGLNELLKWGSYNDADPEDASTEKALSDAAVEAGTQGVSFKVLKTATGYRWLAFSSNSFEDREGEIVSANALSQAIEYADKTGERGTLRLWHTEKTDIGPCDFQALHGRFLIESGTFDDTPKAQKALEYLLKPDVALGISIGFRYKDSEFDGKVYTGARIFERSLAPLSRVANPWTAIKLQEGNVTPEQEQFLTKVLGQDLARDVLDGADKATKALEATVAFKTQQDAAQKPAEDAGQDNGSKSGDDAGQQAVTSQPGDPGNVQNNDGNGGQSQADPADNIETKTALAAIATLVTNLTRKVESMDEAAASSLKALADEMTALRTRVEATESKTKAFEEAAQRAADNTPRGATAYRPTESDQTIIDATKVAEAVAQQGGGKPDTNPVAAYVDDILKGRVS